MESFVFPSVETMLGQSPQRKQITELRSEPVTRKNHGLQIDSWLIYYNSWIIIGPCFVLICIPLSIHGREGDRMRGTWGDVQTSHGHPLIIPMKPCSLMFKLPISDSSSRNGEDWVSWKVKKMDYHAPAPRWCHHLLSAPPWPVQDHNLHQLLRNQGLAWAIGDENKTGEKDESCLASLYTPSTRTVWRKTGRVLWEVLRRGSRWPGLHPEQALLLLCCAGAACSWQAQEGSGEMSKQLHIQGPSWEIKTERVRKQFYEKGGLALLYISVKTDSLAFGSRSVNFW